MNLNQLSEVVKEWHLKWRGEPMVNQPPTIRKFMEEVAEYLEAVIEVQVLDRLEVAVGAELPDSRKVLVDHAGEEFADVLIMMLHLARGAGIENLNFHVKKKLGILHQRLKDHDAGLSDPSTMVGGEPI